MCAARVPDVSWPSRPVVATLPPTIRENAQAMREFAVIEGIPLDSWAPMAITSSSLAPVSPIAVART